MKHKLLFFTFLLAGLFLAGRPVYAQQAQVLDSVDVRYVDNTSDNNTGATGTLMNDPRYREFPPTNPVANVDGWWHNASSLYFGGTSRRASRYGSGNNSGAHAHFYASIPTTDHYLIYHHMNSPNASTNTYVTFKRFGEGVIADSMRYNEQNNMVLDGRSSWYPLGIIELFAADSSLTVEIGLDSLGSNTLRTDAIALVRSQAAGPDLEMGNRRYSQVVVDPVTSDTTVNISFYRHRAPVGFAETTFKYGIYTEKQIPVFNLGSQPLVVTGFVTQTNRFSVTTPVPFTVQPGQKAIMTIRFSPKGEETTFDTLLVLSNDPVEPEAPLPLRGTGINYNFVMNASVTGSEPHWNVPPPGGVFQTIGTFSPSTPSPYQYPITGGNINSVVNIGSDPNIACIYKFNIPDTLSGSYFLEYSGPQGSSNAAQQATIDVVTPFYVNPDPALADTQRVLGFNSRISSAVLWARIGGNKVFQLNGGGETTIRMTNPLQGGTELLRADLIRIRLVPLAPTISTSIDPTRLLNYGSVSIYDSIRQQGQSWQRNFVIGSNGEQQIRLDTIYLKNGSTFSIVNLPTFPVFLPAVDGEYNLLINFLPNEIINYVDTVVIVSNDPDDSLITVRLSGQGVGTGITVDDIDPTTYIYPADPIVWAGAPDPLNMDKWYRVQTSGVNNTRLLHYIYFNPPTGVETVEFYPYFPFEQNSTTNTLDSFDVYLNLSVGSSISSPAARYIVNHANPNDPTPDTIIVNQNSTNYPGGQVPPSGQVYLGRYLFLRGGQDAHGSGTIFGSVYLINDTALVSEYYQDSVVNRARQDSFVVRADAVIFQEAGLPLKIFAEPNVLPAVYSLSQNYPNPFNPMTQIRFTIPEDARVDLKIYDMLGAEIATIVGDNLRAGYYTYEWNGKNNFGQKVSSGIYIYRMVAGDFVNTKKMILMK